MRTDQDLIPKGLRAESLSIHRGRVDISVAPVAHAAKCPMCGHPSRRVHSRYVRTIADLPWHGTPVVFRARVRRFFCDEGPCERTIFCERLPEVAAHARKSSRLDDALLLIAFELGGRAGARLAAQLGLLVSRDALLRRLRGSPVTPVGEVRVLGVDDWASRKGERYGTILVDLERRRVVDLLPDRSANTLTGWLEGHPGVEVVSRDRYRPYIEGASAGAPEAVQVADRFHVLKNLYDAVEKVVERNRRRPGKSDDGPDATPPAKTRPQSGHPGWGHRADPEKREERRERYERVVKLRERGMYVEDIASEVGLHQRTVVAWLHAGGFLERERPKRKKPSPVAPYAEYLERRWGERCINMAQLFREIKELGYEGSYDAVADHLRCLRKGLVPPARAPTDAGEGRTKGTRHESQEIAPADARSERPGGPRPRAGPVSPTTALLRPGVDRGAGPGGAIRQAGTRGRKGRSDGLAQGGRRERPVRDPHLRQGHSPGRGGGEGGYLHTVVQRPGRRPREQAKDAQEADVRAGRIRPAEAAGARSGLTATVVSDYNGIVQETDRIRFAAPSDRPEAGISPEVTGPARRDAPVPREIREASELLKVVGDLTRMRILYALLTDGELSVSGLQKALGMSQSAVSHQLRVLRDTNLVTHRREWKMAYYSLADQHVNDFLRVVLEHIRHD